MLRFLKKGKAPPKRPSESGEKKAEKKGPKRQNSLPKLNGAPKILMSSADPQPLCSGGTQCSDGSGKGNGHHTPGYSSGASTPVDSRSLDGSSHGSGSGRSGRERTNPKSLGHSSSVIGLDSMIESRKEEGDLKNNMVHIEVPFGKPIEEVYDGVHTGPVLGSGISGLVRLVSHKATGVKYAVKCLDLGLVETEEGLQQLREEIYIMCQLDHPNIVRLEEVYESHSEIYLVQELCLGGELFDRLDEQPDYHYTEAECARLVKNMLCAVRYLHSKGIIHRDLKLENFLFVSTSPDSELKMIDFGLSKHFKFGEVQHEAVGTPYTVAPEVIRGSYDECCDIWAIGVITYLLLSGDPPFGGCGGPEPLMQVRANILAGSFEFEPDDIWSIVTNNAKDFIESLLVTDPKRRPTAKQAQRHPWLQEWANRSMKKDGNKLNPNVVKALVNFKEFSDMHKLLCEVLSFTLLPDQIKDLRKEFEKMDTDGSGEISLHALKQVLLTNAGTGSLGALTEEEVEDIFNAMRVRKTETTIHWHEFIAAGLSQCQVDQRNLRLAFDRLDSDHKGYITFENVMDLMGNDAYQSEEAMQTMWKESMRACNCDARITYDDFLLLMKGQTFESPSEREIVTSHLGMSLSKLEAVLEIPESILPESELNDVEKAISPPGTPIKHKSAAGLDKSLSMDEDIPSLPEGGMGSLTPPQSPIRGIDDYVTPLSLRTVSPLGRGSQGPVLPDLPDRPSKPEFVRRRSRSVDDQDPDSVVPDQRPDSEGQVQFISVDARRAMLLPEHALGKEMSIIKDKTKTPLVVNRQLYRAHRQMRLAVLEATKRFEEEQTRRAHEILLAQSEGKSDGQAPVAGAGLVMRHGLKKQVSSETVRNWLKKSQEEQAAKLEKASRRCGRGRSRRQKTTSDMTGMLVDVNTDIRIAPAIPQPDLKDRQSEPFAPVVDLHSRMSDSDSCILEAEPVRIRNATVPGEFRQTKDPFGVGGRYRYKK